MKIRTLVCAVTLFMFVLGSAGLAQAVMAFSSPPSWMPMTMLDITFDSGANKLAIVPTTFAAPLATNTDMMGMPAAGIAAFDPAQPYAVLNGTAFSRRFGWNDPNEMTPAAILPAVQAYYGPGANIWIQSLAQSPGLNTYQAIGGDGLQMGNSYPGIFGTSASSTKWLWDGMMDHNTYAMPFSSLTKPNQYFSAYYKIYVGDAAGNELLVNSLGNPVASAATTTTWGWQGPPFVFTSQTGVATSTLLESDVFTYTGTASTVAITASGEYTISADNGLTWSPWTNLAGTINTNDKVKVRQTSSATTGTARTATLTIPTANGPGTFRVTTLGLITTPGAFSFTSQAAVATSTFIESSPITVTAINAPAAISISNGGEYAVSTDGGATWGAYSNTTPATVAINNRVKVRQLSSSNPGVTTTVTLTIGGVSGAFVVTTGNPVAPSLFFSPVTNAPANTSVSGMPFYVTSNAITATADSTISVAGGITPQYQISTNSGVSWSAWSATTPATVAAGNLVRVHVVPATAPFTTSTTNLNLGSTVASFSVTTGYVNPPSWMPMAMLNVAFNTATSTLSVQDEATHPSFSSGALPALTYVPAGSYDPTKPWGVLNGGVAISRQLGWDDSTALHGNGITVPGSILYQVQTAYPGSGIWIERVSQSPGLETYYADGMFGVGGTGNSASGTPQVYSNATTGLPIIYDNNYYGIFGTDGSSTKWQWDGTMIHNVYAVPAAWVTQPNQLFSATYKVYVGDSLGNEIAGAPSTTEIWTWNGPATVPDNAPDAFSFTNQTGVALNTVVESSPITLTGLAVPALISITGGEYSVSTDGGTTWSTFSTTSPTTVTNGNQVKVRQSSSATQGGTTTSTVTVGGVSGTFSVTTFDATPDAFNLTPLTGVDPATAYESGVITVTGIDTTAAISISTGGSYAISTDNGGTWGAWTSSAGTVSLNNQVKVRRTSAATANTAATVTLTIGGVTGTFSITTNAYNAPPTWMPMTMLNISLTNSQLAIVELANKSPFNTVPPTYPALSTVAPVTTYDPAKPWNVLNSTSFSRRLGWNPAAGFNAAAVQAVFGPTASIWIERLTQSAGLETYQAVGTYGVNANGTTIVDPAAHGYTGIFGTAGSSTKWKWDYLMDHNAYAVPAAYITEANQHFSATYKLYVGNAAGDELRKDANGIVYGPSDPGYSGLPSASYTTIWGWTGPAIVPAVPGAPVATAAAAVSSFGFTANWSAAAGAVNFLLDVSTSTTFDTFVDGYYNRNVNNVTSYPVTGLTPGTTYYYRVRVNNGSLLSGHSNVITVATYSPLSITTGSPLPKFIVGGLYNQYIAVSGGTTPYSWSASVIGSLPPGINFFRATGRLFGSPITAGSYNFTLSVKDNFGTTTSKSFILNSAAPVVISTASTLPTYALGSGAYASTTLSATGGTAPYSWSIASGSTLPAGLYLAGNVLSGTPTAAGTYNFSFKVTDCQTPAVSAVKAFSLVVTGVVATPVSSATLSPSPLMYQAVGLPVRFTAAGAGGSGIPEYQFSVNAGGIWITQPWTTNPVFIWNTTGLSAGSYPVAVYVRNVGSTAPIESWSMVNYVLTAAVTPVTAATLTPSPLTSQTVGLPVQFAATGTGGSGAPEFQFLIYAGGTWTAQPWTTNPVFVWSTAGLSPGSYRIAVYIRNAGSTAPLEAWIIRDYQLN